MGSLMSKYKAAKTSKDTSTSTSKRISKSGDEEFAFMALWKALGKKKQMNLPLTAEIKKIVEGEGGSEYIIKLILKDLKSKKKLPGRYELFL